MPTNRHIAKAEVDLYATTLLEALDKEGGIDVVMTGRSQLDTIVDYSLSHKELEDALESIEYTSEQRAQLIKGVFADYEPALVSVLSVLAERGDFDKLHRIANVFDMKIRERFNVVVVDVSTRVELDDHLRDVIKKKAGADLGCDVVLNETINPDMLGGIVMSANGQRIDASVNTMLDKARTALKQNN